MIQATTILTCAEGHPRLKGFVLFGGTALTLRIGHRISEDLDFAFPAVRLPVDQIKLLVRMMRSEGISFVLNQNPLDEEDFLIAGLDLAQYQQNYLADDSVKVSFVAPEREVASVLRQHPDAPLRVATLDEIFCTKCLACADRNKSRDWFDLYVLMQDHGYTARDLYDTFVNADALPKYDIAAVRLRACKRQIGDEGYEQLIDTAPTDDAMAAFFAQRLDQLERDLAAEAFREQAVLGKPPGIK